MTKKNDHDEVEDREDEEAEGEEEEGEEEESHAKGHRRARASRPSHAHDEHGHDGDEDEDEGEDAEEGLWWTPYAVMCTLLLVGIFGFFGFFNKLLAPLAARPVAHGDTHESAATEPKPKTAEERPQPQQPQQPQQPRELFAAKHLLVMYKGSRRAPESITRTKEEAKTRATEAMKKAKAGTKFEDLVKEYSDEPNAGARGGDLGTFPKGAMVPEFQNALDKMKIGEVSDLVETPFGYHVILRTAPQQPAMPMPAAH